MSADVQIENSWKAALKPEFSKQYFLDLQEFVRNEYKTGVVFPPGKLIFNALNTTALPDVKVVILGQDPYHGAGQAMGLSFSVPAKMRIPPSLQNIYKEIEADLGTTQPPDGDLTRWSKQGVLLLNATLTVRSGQPGSHQGKGWEVFTDEIIKTISEKRQDVVFILWGNFAGAKEPLIDSTKHLVLKAAHPSPFSAHKGFFGCKHFSKANAYLKEHGQVEIAW